MEHSDVTLLSPTSAARAVTRMQDTGEREVTASDLREGHLHLSTRMRVRAGLLRGRWAGQSRWKQTLRRVPADQRNPRDQTTTRMRACTVPSGSRARAASILSLIHIQQHARPNSPTRTQTRAHTRPPHAPQSV